MLSSALLHDMYIIPTTLGRCPRFSADHSPVRCSLSLIALKCSSLPEIGRVSTGAIHPAEASVHVTAPDIRYHFRRSGSRTRHEVATKELGAVSEPFATTTKQAAR